MTAVDTNVVIRLLTQDDRQQAAHANTIFATGDVWIAKTVLLEASWVLIGVYGFEAKAVRGAFLMLMGLPSVTAEDSTAVLAALALTEQGIDFADALHLESRPRDAQFLTFDQKFVRRTQKAGVQKITGMRR